MPESLYAFKPTPEVRSFGEILAHVAGSEFFYCAAALGEKARDENAIMKTATTKAAIVQALKESGDYCAVGREPPAAWAPALARSGSAGSAGLR